jgi:hypothetical protein
MPVVVCDRRLKVVNVHEACVCALIKAADESRKKIPAIWRTEGKSQREFGGSGMTAMPSLVLSLDGLGNC